MHVTTGDAVWSTVFVWVVHFLLMNASVKLMFALADLRGAPGARPPYGSRFFRFDMQNFRNVAASGVHGPPYEVHAPPTGNPGSATGLEYQNRLFMIQYYLF